MSYENFQEAKNLAKKYTFETLIMAAIAVAPTEDLRKLHAVFPELLRESVERRNTRDGILASDPSALG
jgi:hypothetical protein